MPSRGGGNEQDVFLNVPFDKAYEPLFVSLLAALVALGRTPRCVLELPETGDGRLNRILRLIRSCPVSIHDLSRVGVPVRFNMPFELGIAVAVSRVDRGHRFVILEKERYRLQKTLSDVNGFDPGIHGATRTGIISCVLSHLGKPHGNVSPSQVEAIRKQLWKTVPVLKRQHGRQSIYSRAIFMDLAAGAILLAKKYRLIRD
jgi:hypothetical protein